MCTRRCCRKHCRALGGCGAKGHDSDPVLDDTLQLRHQPNTNTFSTEPTFSSLDETVHATHNSIPSRGAPLPLQSTSFILPPTRSPVDHTTGPAAHDGPDSQAVFEEDPSPRPCQGPSRILDKGKGKDPAENPRPSQLKRKASAVPLADQPRHTIHLDPIFTRAYAEAEEADARHRQRTKEQRDAIERAKNQVTLYVWNEVYICLRLHFHSLITLVMI